MRIDISWKLQINILCLIGAIIGIVAILSPWFEVVGRRPGVHPIGDLWILYDANVLDLVTDPSVPRFAIGYSLSDYFIIAAFSFIIGVIISFISSIGAIPQIIGLAVIVIDNKGNPPTEIGVYLAIISVIVILVSLFRPIGTGYVKGQMRWRERLLTFGWMKKKP